jgi:hypothetical protein
VGPRTGLNVLAKRKISCHLVGFEPRIVQPIDNHCSTDYAIPAVVSLIVIYMKYRHVLLAFAGSSRFFTYFLLFSS